MKKLRIRLVTAFRILFCKYNHWLIINLTDEQLIKLLQEKDFDGSMMLHGLQEYNAYKIIKMVANSKDDIDMLLGKIAFENKALKKTPPE